MCAGPGISVHTSKNELACGAIISPVLLSACSAIVTFLLYITSPFLILAKY
jgi:hypothetical protein